MTLAVTNRLNEPTSIHWHGIRTPTDMDGVPGLSFPGIAPGTTFTYRFPVHQSGTYWYHSHSGFQEQSGLYGALVIDPKAGPAYAFDRDYVVLLSDWTDENPHVPRDGSILFVRTRQVPRGRTAVTERGTLELMRKGMLAAVADVGFTTGTVGEGLYASNY